MAFLSQGALFFDSLLQKLQTAYQFKLEDYMDGMAIRARPLRKTVLLLFFVCAYIQPLIKIVLSNCIA